jgi:hypothetical protein
VQPCSTPQPRSGPFPDAGSSFPGPRWGSAQSDGVIWTLERRRLPTGLRNGGVEGLSGTRFREHDRLPEEGTPYSNPVAGPEDWGISNQGLLAVPCKAGRLCDMGSLYAGTGEWSSYRCPLSAADQPCWKCPGSP